MIYLSSDLFKADPPLTDQARIQARRREAIARNIDRSKEPWNKRATVGLELPSYETDPHPTGYSGPNLKRWVSQYATEFDIPEKVLWGIIQAESGGNPRAKAKSTSATGLTQFIKKTAEKQGFKPEDRLDPQKSVQMAAKYLSSMRADFARRKIKDPLSAAIRAYWIGPERVTGPKAYVQQPDGKLKYQRTKGYQHDFGPNPAMWPHDRSYGYAKRVQRAGESVAGDPAKLRYFKRNPVAAVGQPGSHREDRRARSGLAEPEKFLDTNTPTGAARFKQVARGAGSKWKPYHTVEQIDADTASRALGKRARDIRLTGHTQFQDSKRPVKPSKKVTARQAAGFGDELARSRRSLESKASKPSIPAPASLPEGTYIGPDIPYATDKRTTGKRRPLETSVGEPPTPVVASGQSPDTDSPVQRNLNTSVMLSPDHFMGNPVDNSYLKPEFRSGPSKVELPDRFKGRSYLDIKHAVQRPRLEDRQPYSREINLGMQKSFPSEFFDNHGDSWDSVVVVDNSVYFTGEN